MYRNNFCYISDDVQRKYSLLNSKFLKQVVHEDEKMKQVTAQEILMTSENPMIREQNQIEEVCKELKVIERDKFLEEKHRTMLHQNEDEIRQLAVQIKRANIQRELIEQKAAKDKQLREEYIARQNENKRVAEQLQRLRETSLREERESAQKKNDFRHELIKQMQERDKQREREKEMINEEREERKKLLEYIKNDIESEKQHALKTKQMIRKDKDDYLQQVEIYKSQQKSNEEEERKKYLEWVQQRDEEERLRKEKCKQEKRRKEALSENIGQQVLSIQKEKQERESLLLELLIGERLDKDDTRHRLNLEQQSQRAKNLSNDFLTYFARKQQEVLLNREREKLAHQEEMRIARDLAKAEEDIKNMKIPRNKEHREELLNAIAYKKYQRELEAQHSKALYEQELAAKRKRQQEIEAEKLRLLKAQPKRNLKFLPRTAINADHCRKLGLTCRETKENTN